MMNTHQWFGPTKFGPTENDAIIMGDCPGMLQRTT